MTTKTAKDIPVIDLYTWTTPNGRKVSIALEELGLPYTVHPVDISKDEQFKPEFLKIAPNNRIPAIVDRDNNMALMESGAILIYLADKTGKLLPKSGEGRYRVIEWLMWQMGGPGPMLGQVHHFVKYNKGKAPYAEERYLKEGQRLYKVLNTRLEGRQFVADDYSIADIAIWPWISRFEWQTIDMKQYPNVKRWYETIAARPAVQKGYTVPKDMGPIPMPLTRAFATAYPRFVNSVSVALAFKHFRNARWPLRKKFRNPILPAWFSAPTPIMGAAIWTRRRIFTGRCSARSRGISTRCICAAC